MANKILVNYSGSLTNDGLASKRQSVADQLGVCAEDVILLPGLSVSVVDLPDELTKAREKADRQAEKDAQEAEADAQARASEDARAEADAIRALQQQAAVPARVNLPPGTPDSRRKEELTEQHSTDVRRETAGETRPATTPAGDEKSPRRDADEKDAATRPEAKGAAGAADEAPADYDSWTLEELHAEATKRDLHGRSGLDKAGLVKALQKHDKADARKK